MFCCTLIHASSFAPEARWITAAKGQVNAENTWIAFRRNVEISHLPMQVEASIAADSKYWLWVNGKMVVFEGQLKRGPTAQDTYFDRVDLTRYLKKGHNEIAILLWYFGKDGFSHNSSGQSGLLFSAPAIGLHSDYLWLSRIHPAYGTCGAPKPNMRLCESSISYDGRLDLGDWHTGTVPDGFKQSRELGSEGSAPWNALVERPIPLWKDFGVKRGKYTLRQGEQVDTLQVDLPYNMQLTPVIDVEDAVGGNVIDIKSDHLYGGGEPNVWAQYVTRPGRQKYESLGWFNAEHLYVYVPHGVKVKSIAYRETGYNSEEVGGFHCDDIYFNTYWRKAMRTLYVNMRDTYFDCPDRERAQWWGDGCLLMAECFYSHSTSSHAMAHKGLLELCKHQRDDYTIYSPVPGVWNAELPAQMLATVGLPGVWKYYMHTGDKATLEELYPYIRNYLSIWKLEEGGLTIYRKTEWNWGDWGENRDMRLIYAAWHYMALDAAARMADVLNKPHEAEHYRTQMARLKVGFNKCWNGSAYRHPDYTEETDDRIQALAVVSGLADADKYAAIKHIFRTQYHSSPYMEKYVTDACFIMGDGNFGMERVRDRYRKMVEHPDYTTLFEGWGIGREGYGGGTTNHAWSGGPFITICEYLMGVTPLHAGWSRFQVKPNIVTFGQASLDVPTMKGMVHFSFKKHQHKTVYRLIVPKGAEAVYYLPTTNLNLIKGKMQYLSTDTTLQQKGYTTLLLPAGEYKYSISSMNTPFHPQTGKHKMNHKTPHRK